MNKVTLTCKNHPNLRWSCKEIAVNADGSYNGSRSIFFNGDPSDPTFDRWADDAECPCPFTDLTFAPKTVGVAPH